MLPKPDCEICRGNRRWRGWKAVFIIAGLNFVWFTVGFYMGYFIGAGELDFIIRGWLMGIG